MQSSLNKDRQLLKWQFLDAICIVTHLQASFLWERQFEKVLLGKSAELGLLVCSSKTKIILPVHVDDIKMAHWKEAAYGSHVEEIDEECWSWRTNLISWSRILGMYSTWM